MVEDTIYWALSLGIIAGLFLVLWLRERPCFRCVECDVKVKYRQFHCQNCGVYLQWDWFRKRPFLLSKYQTNEQFKKWDIRVPKINPNKGD